MCLDNLIFIISECLKDCKTSSFLVRLGVWFLLCLTMIGTFQFGLVIARCSV